MNYKQAVEAALQGNADAFSALYESTQNNMYYLALKYMKNPDDAKDVLQDAYIKAWQSLPTLKDPEHFPAWLGRIVANTAKNMLVKKKPDLFSELEKENEDGDEFVFQIEDENTSYQPELNYTQKETQILVRELIDSLSDEQRFCILMYHLEGQSIKEIAETLDVSENTVKSRLNYGRKALKNKAEELKKKGYQLYSIAPLPLLLYLLRSESKSPAFTHAAKTVMLSRKETIMQHAGQSVQLYKNNNGNGSDNAGNGNNNRNYKGKNVSGTVAKSAGTAAKHSFLASTAGKTVLGIAAGLIIGGGGAAGVTYLHDTLTAVPVTQYEPEGNETEQTTEEEASRNTADITETPQAETNQEEETQAEATPTPEPSPTPESAEKILADDEYSSKIAGNLTKEEMEFVLAYGPQEMPIDGDSYMPYAITQFAQGRTAAGETFLPEVGRGTNGSYFYNLAQFNRLYSAFTSFQLSEDNDSDTEYGINVEGDNISVIPGTMEWHAECTINSAEYTDTEMKIHYTYLKRDPEDGESTINKVATLKPAENNLYRITKIEEDTGAADNLETEAVQETTAAEGESDSVTAAYQAVLEQIAAAQPETEFSEELGEAQYSLEGTPVYTLYDMNQDGTDELIVGQGFYESSPIGEMVYRVYTCENDGSGYQAKKVNGTWGDNCSIFRAPDGNGLYSYYFSRGTGKESYTRITIQDGTIVTELTDYETLMGSEESNSFYEQYHLNMTDVSDLSALGN